MTSEFSVITDGISNSIIYGKWLRPVSSTVGISLTTTTSRWRA